MSRGKGEKASPEKELSIALPPSVPPQLEQEVEVLRTFLREGLAQDSLAG